MTTFGCSSDVDEHNAYRILTDESRFRWLYKEPNSHHNHAKHWVGDVNNHRHSPIDLADAWQTKWWPNRQLTFFISC